MTRGYHFDTHDLIGRLEKEGLTREQAVGLTEALEDVIDESIQSMVANLVTRSEQEKHQYTQKARRTRVVLRRGLKERTREAHAQVDFAKLKSEIQLVEKQDFSLLKDENERLLADVEKLKQRLREEMTRTQAGVRLDLNLEKGRMRDELSAREIKIREVDTRIEGDISQLRSAIEQAKFNVLQYVMGTLRFFFSSIRLSD